MMNREWLMGNALTSQLIPAAERNRPMGKMDWLSSIIGGLTPDWKWATAHGKCFGLRMTNCWLRSVGRQLRPVGRQIRLRFISQGLFNRALRMTGVPFGSGLVAREMP